MAKKVAPKTKIAAPAEVLAHVEDMSVSRRRSQTEVDVEFHCVGCENTHRISAGSVDKARRLIAVRIGDCWDKIVSTLTADENNAAQAPVLMDEA